jgi:hypothetical protein
LSSALCGPLATLSVVADTFIVGEGSSGAPLKPSFTWHGFQHVIVTVSASVEFTATTASLSAEWTAMNAPATGSISFGGGDDATTMNKIMNIVQAGQLSNMAGFVPTDCPTRVWGAFSTIDSAVLGLESSGCGCCTVHVFRQEFSLEECH